MKRLFCSLALIAAVAGLSSGQTVLNGGFETGAAPPFGGAYVPAPDSTTISGWKVQSGSVDYIGSDTWPAADGSRSLDMSGHDAGTIRQEISGFIPGHQYRLSFYMAANNDGVARIFRLRARIGALTETFSFDATGRTYADMGWSLRTMDFTATTATMALMFTSLEDGDAGPALDNVSISTVPAPCVPAPAGLVSWWRAENNASDEVGGNNGMLMGNVSFVPGKVGMGFGLNGADSYVQIPHSASLNLTNEFTLELWYLEQGKTWWYSMMTKRDGGYAPANFGIHVGPPGFSQGLQLFFTDPTVGGDSTSDYLPVPASGVFHHLAATFRQADSTHVELKTFVDGLLVKTTTVLGNLANTVSTAPILIGADYAAQDIFKGIIDEVSIYNRALSLPEIQGIYNAGSAGKCTSPPPPACVTPPSGLVSWWRAEGTGQDAASANNATLLNGATYGSGEVGQGFSFDGNIQCVQIPYSPSLIASNYSVETWIKPAAQVSDPIGQDLIFGQSFGHCQLVARTGTSGLRIVWQFGTSHFTFYEVASASEIPIGQFTHLAGTWDGTTLRLYINGVLNAQRTPGAAPEDSGCPFFIGGFYSPAPDNCQYVGQFFNGLIDEVSFANRALSASEIQSIYNAGESGKCASQPPPCAPAAPGVVGWWRGETNSIDSVGNDNGTNVGNVTYSPGKVGQAFTFDGTSSGVRLGNPVNLQLQNFTIEAWVKRASTARTTLPFIYDNAAFLHYGELGYGFGPTHDGRLLLTKVGIGGVYSSAVRVADTNYHHVAVTKIGSVVTFYVDGVGEVAAPYDPGFVFNTPVAIGARGTDMAASFLGAIDELAVYNRALSPLEIQSIYAAGGAGKCVPVPPVNRPPLADASATQPRLIVPDGCSPTVVLDGSRSSDPDADPLQYRWFRTGAPHAFATGVVAVVTLPLGAQAITLVVDDGVATGTNTVTVTVLAAHEAVQGLIAMVTESDIRHPRPLLAMLSAAADSIRRHHPRVAIIQLRAFQRLVQVEVIRRDSVLAAKLVQASQRVIEALSQDCAAAGSHWKLGKMLRQSNSQMRMTFSAPERQRCLIEASTNLVDWERIGAANECGPGEFEFADPDAARLPARFYRVVDEER